MDALWYVLRSKPRKEEILWRQASIRGFEIFYPRIGVKPVNPRSSKQRPYFPGYMFIKADLEEVALSAFNYIPYAVGLVSFGVEPAPVSESLILALRRRLREIEDAGGDLFDGLCRGDLVWIQDGPFVGYRALFDDRLPGDDRVRVLMKMLSDRYVSVELEAATIAKVIGSPSQSGLQYAA